jgi:hypothetical protein
MTMPRGTRLHEQDYYVTLDCGDGGGWTVRLTYNGWGKVERPTNRRLAADARRAAIKAFGPQARSWKRMIRPPEKATKRERVL